MNLRTSCDIEEAAQIWRALWPAEDVFGCWDVRECFHRSYGRPPHFVIAECDGKPAGFLGLSLVEEYGYYGQFPGETWQGRTWFEQNRIPASSDTVRRMLWDAAPDDTRMRYMVAGSAGVIPGSAVDETGYILRPAGFGYDFEKYWNTFSGKSRKKLGREIEALGDLEYSQDGGETGDIEWMFETNRANFGERSYFDDRRFLGGFRNMISLLSERDMLRVSRVSVRGRKAAVDVGAVCNNRYTVLAGATDPEFPGIAKAINLCHIRWGCGMRIDQIDFLCGDFGWKERFHLEPRPLFMSMKADPDESAESSVERTTIGASSC